MRSILVKMLAPRNEEVKSCRGGDRVLVRNGDVVQGPIVPTGSPVSRFFLGHHV